MQVKVLASGSKGNVTYVCEDDTRILIDIGMRCCYVEEKLKEMNVDPRSIDAILITHIHNDHIMGLHTFARKYKTKVYISESMKSHISCDNYGYLSSSFNIKNINIKAFRTSHDVESFGYLINDELVYITDTGYINERYFDLLSNKKMYIMESNHDVEMLMEGPYPYHLKQRILKDTGHLSNEESSKYLSHFIGNNTSCVVLAHLSETNNNEEIALCEFKKREKKYNGKVLVAHQLECTELIQI